MNYNCLLVKYKNSWQLRTYQFTIKSDSANIADREDVFSERPEKENKKVFENVENEIDKSFSAFDETLHFSGHSAYVSLNRSKNKIFYLARSNDWTNGYFCTFTIDPKKYNSFDYKVISDLIRKFNDSLRHYDSNIYALFVPEKHKSGAFHLHGLVSSGLKDFLNYSGHNIHGQKIYNCSLWKYGFSNVTEVTNTLAVEKYITKYTTKELLNDTLYQHRYYTLNLSCADMIRLNLYNHTELFKELIKNDCVLYNNTDGLYNRCTYTELKNSEKTLTIIKEFINITNELISI